MSFFLLIFFLIVITFSENIDDKVNNIRNLQTESEFQNIRIYVNDDCLGSSSSSQSSDPSQNTTNTKITKDAIEKARLTLQRLVKVHGLTNKIKIDEYKDIIPQAFHGCASVFNNYLNDELDCDLIIFIRSPIAVEEDDITDPVTNIIKYVGDDGKSRPLIGTIIHKFSLDKTDEEKIQALSTLFLHEFTHILGFRRSILQNIGILETKQLEDRINQIPRSRTFVTGENVVKIAKDYFKCPTLNGVEIDDTPYDGTDNIHWHARILLGDYMIATNYYMDQAISEITLALLVDLGWYQVNYYTGGLMRFGKNKGCQFLENDCIEQYDKNGNPYGLKSSFPNEFCSSIYSNYGTCSSGRQSMAYCFNTFIYDNLLDHPIYVRSRISAEVSSGYSDNELVEYCPLIFDYNNNYQIPLYYDGNCKLGKSQYGSYTNFLRPQNKKYSDISQFIEEKYSSSSFCAFSSLLKDDSNNPSYINGILRPTCYEMSCSEKSLTIHINDEFIVCPRKGGTIKIESSNSKYKGYLICPDYNLICTGSKVCNNIFDCVDNNSTVKDLTFNYDYSPSSDITAELSNNQESSITNYITDEIYELGDEGVCPQYCKKCKENKQCTECDPVYKYYIGTKEGDTEALKCSKDHPTKH